MNCPSRLSFFLQISIMKLNEAERLISSKQLVQLYCGSIASAALVVATQVGIIKELHNSGCRGCSLSQIAHRARHTLGQRALKAARALLVNLTSFGIVGYHQDTGCFFLLKEAGDGPSIERYVTHFMGHVGFVTPWDLQRALQSHGKDCAQGTRVHKVLTSHRAPPASSEGALFGERVLCALLWSQPSANGQTWTLDAVAASGRVQSVMLAHVGVSAWLVGLRTSFFDLPLRDGLRLQCVSKALGWPREHVHIWLEVLCAHGLLYKERNYFFRSPATDKYLVTPSPCAIRPHYMGDWLATDEGAYITPTALAHSITQPSSLMMQSLHDDRLVAFGCAMHSMTVRSAAYVARALVPILHRFQVVLDIGAGSGTFLQELLLQPELPHLQGIFFDLPNMCHFAKQRLEADGSGHLRDRITFVAGDMFSKDHFPQQSQGPTLIIFGSVFHDWPSCNNLLLLAKALRALRSGGCILVHELFLHPDPTKCSVEATAMDVAMLHWADGGQVTVDQVKHWMGVVTRTLPDGLAAALQYAVIEGDDGFDALLIHVPPWGLDSDGGWTGPVHPQTGAAPAPDWREVGPP